MAKNTTSSNNEQTVADQTFAAWQAIQAERHERDRQVVEENREWCEQHDIDPTEARGLFA